MIKGISVDKFWSIKVFNNGSRDFKCADIVGTKLCSRGVMKGSTNWSIAGSNEITNDTGAAIKSPKGVVPESEAWIKI